MMIYWFAINLLALCLMYIDKQKARRKSYRISERTLWLVAFLGGALGATVGMKWFRHKTKHPQFKMGLPILAILEAGLIWFFFFQS